MSVRIKGSVNENIIRILKLTPSTRNHQDLRTLVEFLSCNESLMGSAPINSQRENALIQISKIARYKKINPEEILFLKGDFADQWYILLSGSVIIDSNMFFQNNCFGIRPHASHCRNADCIALEDSELIIIDYPIDAAIAPTNNKNLTEHRQSFSSTSTDERSSKDISKNSKVKVEITTHSSNSSLDLNELKRGSRDVGQIELELLDDELLSDECEKDAFLEALRKDVSKRTRNDIQFIFDHLHNLPAFNSFTQATAMSLCTSMKTEFIKEPNTIFLNQDDPLEAWYILLYGEVQVTDLNGFTREFSRGDSFGTKASSDPELFQGVMVTLTDDCHFGFVLKKDFLDIMANDGATRTTELGEASEPLLVYEKLVDDESGLKIVTKGTPEKLLDNLIEDQVADPTYVEDFLLMYRTFIDSPYSVASKITSWLTKNSTSINSLGIGDLNAEENDKSFRARRCMLKWVCNHFSDFENHQHMIRFLEQFDQFTLCENMLTERRIFLLACSNKSIERHLYLDLTISKTIPNSALVSNASTNGKSAGQIVLIPFTLIGGFDSFGIFISQFDSNFKNINITDDSNENRKLFNPVLNRGDELLALNGQKLTNLTAAQAIQTLMSQIASSDSFQSKQQLQEFPFSCRINLTVKYNPLQYQELLSITEKSLTNSKNSIASLSPVKKSSLGELCLESQSTKPFGIFVQDSRRQNIMLPTSLSIPQSLADFTNVNLGTPPLPPHHKKLRSNSRNDDLTLCNLMNGSSGDIISQHSSFEQINSKQNLFAVRIWRSSDMGREQSSKLIVVGVSTNVNEACRLAAEEFGIPEDQMQHQALYQVSVEPGPLVKQSRLADSLSDLANRVTMNSRFYLRELNKSTEVLMTDEIAKSILKECQISLNDIELEELAVHVTLKNYNLFKIIGGSEFVDKVFELSNKLSTPGSPSHGDQNVTDLSLKSDSSGYGSCGPSPTPSFSTPSLCSHGKGFATGHNNLHILSELVNNEAYWAPSEICSEPNLNKRTELLKRFIKLVKLFRQLRNYNSMFCLLLGLDQTAVKRLQKTWDKLPEKYSNMYNQLSGVLDPRQNFANYRALLNNPDPMFSGRQSAFRRLSSSEIVSKSQNSPSMCLRSPLIPYLPLVLKDLSFINWGNPTKTDEGLINFVKMRMFAKEVRKIQRFFSVDYDQVMAWAFIRDPRGTSILDQPPSDRKKRSIGVREMFQTRLSLKSDLKPPKTSIDDLALDSSKIAPLTNFLQGFTTLKRAGSSGLNLPFLTDDSCDKPDNSEFNKRSSTIPTINTKKLYFSCVKSLQIKTYLNTLKIVKTSEELIEMVNSLDGNRLNVQQSLEITTQPTNVTKLADSNLVSSVVIRESDQEEKLQIASNNNNILLQSPYANASNSNYQITRSNHNSPFSTNGNRGVPMSALVPTQRKYYPLKHQPFCPHSQMNQTNCLMNTCSNARVYQGNTTSPKKSSGQRLATTINPMMNYDPSSSPQNHLIHCSNSPQLIGTRKYQSEHLVRTIQQNRSCSPIITLQNSPEKDYRSSPQNLLPVNPMNGVYRVSHSHRPYAQSFVHDNGTSIPDFNVRPNQPPPYEMAINLRRNYLQNSSKPIPPPRTITNPDHMKYQENQQQQQIITSGDIEQRTCLNNADLRHQRMILTPTTNGDLMMKWRDNQLKRHIDRREKTETVMNLQQYQFQSALHKHLFR